MRNYFPKGPSGAPLHTLSKLYDVFVGFVSHSSFEAVYCFICGRRRVAVARYRMICLVLINSTPKHRVTQMAFFVILSVQFSAFKGMQVNEKIAGNRVFPCPL